VDRVISLQWDHSIDDCSAVPSYNFSSWDTWKHYKLGASCLVYALDSSRTTPLVEEVPKQDAIHFSQFPISRAGVAHQWGTSAEKRASVYDQIRHSLTWLGGRDGYPKPFVKPQGHRSIVSEKQGVRLIGS
jgi:hypothetical protein